MRLIPRAILSCLALLLGGCGPDEDDTATPDRDGDGYITPVDCDDTDPTVHPGATEVWYDGVDQDCDGRSDDDQDGDGYDLAPGQDCDDADPTVHPGATEVWYDGVDQDCDGAWDYDQDTDGCDPTWCGDCDDTDPSVHPGAAEVPCDDVDQDCDGEDSLIDLDLDGYLPPDCGGGDCDDLDPAVHPGTTEHCNGVDDDCDGVVDEDDAEDAPRWYLDADGDGIGGSVAGPRSCAPIDGSTPFSGDCDDGDPAEYPGVLHEMAGYPMTCVGAGGFFLGSPMDEVGRSAGEWEQSEWPLDHAYLVGLYEIELSRFVAVTGLAPSPPTTCRGADDCVVAVSHAAADHFANLLSRSAGLPECYDCRFDADGYPDWCDSLFSPETDCDGFRLTGWEEWEKAARAGTMTAFSNGGNLLPGDEESCSPDLVLDNGERLDAVAVFCGSSPGAPQAPGTRAPNPWGLYDAHGNLGEWTSEWGTYSYLWYWGVRGSTTTEGFPHQVRSFAYDMGTAFDLAGFRLVLNTP